MNIKEKRDAAIKSAREIAERALADGNRGFTTEEKADIDRLMQEVDQLAEQIKSAEQDEDRLARIGALTPAAKAGGAGIDQQAKSIGEHFIKHAGAQLLQMKGRSGATVDAPEYKAATDTQVVGSVFQGPVLTEYDRTFVRAFQPRLVVADLLGSGVIGSDKNAISYFVEGALEGAFTTVAEAAAKPQLHVADPTLVTDGLKKIAGFIKNSDEMVEDLDFFMTEINNRLLDALRRFEEAQLLNGNGSGTNVLGLLNRSGVQTEAAADNTDNADAIFRAMTKVATATGLDADAIVINPIDYQALRLGKDGNGQYMGGGYFAGQYGNGSILVQPPLWGLRTVVTPAIAAGLVGVGALSTAATVYRKGGIRVESTNSHASDFTSNLVTTRAEERVALAVRYPSAVVKVTLSATDPA